VLLALILVQPVLLAQEVVCIPALGVEYILALEVEYTLEEAGEPVEAQVEHMAQEVEYTLEVVYILVLVLHTLEEYIYLLIVD
jgi:hypothetical protein